MLRYFICGLLLCGLLSRVTLADPIIYQQVLQDRQKQIAGQSVGATAPPAQGGQVQQPQTQTEGDLPKFVRLPDGRIVPYGPDGICTENCVEPFEARAPSRLRVWMWGVPLIAGGLLAGLVGAGVLGGGPAAQASVAPTTNPTVGITPSPTPTVLPSPTPNVEIPEPSTLILLGIGMTMLLRRRAGRKENQP
jgi:hypothetical protein